MVVLRDNKISFVFAKDLPLCDDITVTISPLKARFEPQRGHICHQFLCQTAGLEGQGWCKHVLGQYVDASSESRYDENLRC